MLLVQLEDHQYNIYQIFPVESFNQKKEHEKFYDRQKTLISDLIWTVCEIFMRLILNFTPEFNQN